MLTCTWFLFPEDYDEDEDADDEGGGDAFGPSPGSLDSAPPTIPILMTPDDDDGKPFYYTFT